MSLLRIARNRNEVLNETLEKSKAFFLKKTVQATHIPVSASTVIISIQLRREFSISFLHKQFDICCDDINRDKWMAFPYFFTAF